MREARNNHDWSGELFFAPRKSLQIEFRLSRQRLEVELSSAHADEWKTGPELVDTLIARLIRTASAGSSNGNFPHSFTLAAPFHQYQSTTSQSPIHFRTSFYHCNHLFCFLLSRYDVQVIFSRTRNLAAVFNISFRFAFFFFLPPQRYRKLIGNR